MLGGFGLISMTLIKPRGVILTQNKKSSVPIPCHLQKGLPPSWCHIINNTLKIYMFFRIKLLGNILIISSP